MRTDMVWLAFLLGVCSGAIVAFLLCANAMDGMISDRIKAGAMHHKGAAYRITPLESPVDR